MCPTNNSLQLPLQDVYKIGGISTVPVGQAETSVSNLHGDHLCFSHFYNWSKVCWNAPWSFEQALPGDNMGFNVKNISLKDVHCGNATSDNKNYCEQFINFDKMEKFLQKHNQNWLKKKQKL